METILVAIFATAFVIVIFWFVAKTIGKFQVVKNSPTLNDLQDLTNPGRAAARESTEALPEAVRVLADSGDKLAATIAYKDLTGVSLMEAKNAVEEYINHGRCP